MSSIAACLTTNAFVPIVTILMSCSVRYPSLGAVISTTSSKGPQQQLRRYETIKMTKHNMSIPKTLGQSPSNLKNYQRKKKILNNIRRYQDFNFHPENSFKCPPCVCKNISSNSVSVFCEDIEFSDHLPQNWPVEIDGIYFKRCDGIKVFDGTHFLIYTSLKYIRISTNSLVLVRRSSSVNISSTVIELDLSWNMIQQIEEESFEIFPSLLKLSLSHNNIKNLTRQMFAGLSSLRYLSATMNEIDFIANDTFKDLENLVSLDISKNRIVYRGHALLPHVIFMRLKLLEELYIEEFCQRGSQMCGAYPNTALQLLTNLKVLSIDGADRRGLGPEIKSLVHLKTLIITYQETGNFTNESYFDNVPFLTTLVYYMNCPNINSKAYTSLNNLVNFTFTSLTYPRTNICQLLVDIQYLVNSSLKYLSLKLVNDRECGCKELVAKDARYLTMLRLTELDLSKNYLDYLSPDFLDRLPPTLLKIDLSGNGLSYEIFYSFDNFPKGLIELTLSNQLNIYYPCQADHGVMKKRSDEAKNQHSTNKSSINEFIESSKKSFEPHNIRQEVHNTNVIEVSKDFLPPKLRVLRGDNFRKFGKLISDFYEFLSKYSLSELSLANGEFKTWASSSLMPDTEIAIFSNNYAEYFNPIFFPENNSLKYLSISDNLFGPAFQYDTDHLFFAETKQLVALDMSKNFVTEIPEDYFRNLIKLQVLDISQNKLQMINMRFSHMTELIFLDFSTNSITSISKISRDELDIIATNHRVYLDLTFNPLPCTCQGLELMKWMAFTNVYLLHQDFLVCRNELNQILEIGNIVQRVETLRHQCGSKTVIILTCVFSIIVFGILLITSLIYRYRWKLRYLRSIALVKLLGSRPGATNKIAYRFDAYILYTDDTRRFVVRDCVRELEDKRGHRLCIEERDFLPGTYNVSNIVSGVQNSAKTVAMVTPEFYLGEYSEYSVKMALMEEIFMRRSVLFLCVCEPTDDKDLSHDLLTAMKQNNYIEYPPRDDVTDEIMEEFWNQFSRAIGRNDRQEI